MAKQRPHWCKLEMHCARCALCLAFANAGKSIAARIAMIAITTSNSIRVNPELATDGFLRFALDIGAIGLAVRVIEHGTCNECDDDIPRSDGCLASQRYGSL